MSAWTEPAAPDPPLRGRGDWALAAAVALAVLSEVVFREDLVWPLVAGVLGLALAGAVLVRRSHPFETAIFAFASFTVLDVCTFLADSEPVVLYSGAVVLLLAYSLFRWGSGRHAAIGLLFMACSVAASTATDYTGAADVIGGASVLLFMAALGVSIRFRLATRDQLVEQAKLQERELIARELHDTVAHHVSAIAIQAQAGLFLAKSSSLSGATEALQVIEEEAAHTLTEMRTMVSALRDRPGALAVAQRRTIADIEQLVSRSTATVQVVVRRRGELTLLPSALETALYQVVQESITNSLRHARGATRIDVEVWETQAAVHLTISDNGDRVHSRPPGFGIVGMTERVTLLGGTLDASPKADGGWLVQVTLPPRGKQ